MSFISDYLCGYLLIMLFTIGKSEDSPGHGLNWYYPDDDSWPQTCRGKKQSPIEIFDSNVLRRNEPLWELNMVNYNKTISCQVVNEGHTVYFHVNGDDDLYVTGGGLKGKYSLKQIHFHWKSEHTLNGNRIPLEAHFVHSLNKGESHNRVKRANVYPGDDLHVIGVFYKLADDENKELSEVIKAVQKASPVNSTGKIEFIPSVLLPKKLFEFYRYEGSLTTPPCYEIVHWTVFPHMVNMSQDQYDKFREVEGFGGKYAQNYRHIMPLNNRIIKLYRTSSHNSPSFSFSPGIQSNKCIYIFFFVIFFMF